MPEQNSKDLIKKLPFWQYLQADEKDLVLSRLAVIRYQARQLVRGGEEDCLGLIMVIRGSLRAYLMSLDGREMTLYRITQNDFCVLSADCVLEAISFDTMVMAEEDTDVLLMPIDVFTHLLNNNIHVEKDAYAKGTERFSEVVAGLERLLFLSLDQRLASFLVDESASRNSDTIYMTHAQIAANIGSARETVSRALKIMAEQDWVELVRGAVKIKNKKALYQLL